MWPTDAMNTGEVNEDGQPLDQLTLMRLSRVFGLAARQRVPLTLEKFEDLTEDEKNELFMNSIQWYVVYPEELKEKGKRAAMKGISHSWRGYKNKLVTCLRKKQNPFEKFKDLKEEDWERFVAKCESPKFVANSEYMWQLWAQNELNHHLGNTRYARKQSKWEQEDQRLAEQGVENPYDKFSEQLKHSMRARSKLTEIGEITYYNKSTEEVAQRGLRESSQGSNEDERENGTLSRALRTKEQWGHVRGVSSKLT
jgi:hypothetical protein